MIIVKLEYFYHINLFIITLYIQLHELNNRFCDNTIKLLTLSSTLKPKDLYKLVDVKKICDLTIKFYHDDVIIEEKFQP